MSDSQGSHYLAGYVEQPLTKLAAGRRFLRQHGLPALVELGAVLVALPLVRRWLAARGPRFRFQGRDFALFLHPHNITWFNERAVELPIVLDLVRRYPAARVLEVGNVLRHYAPVRHAVIDKYEAGHAVQNVDAADFSSASRYDLIISVSTLEHVGYDEDVKDPEKSRRVLSNLAEHLRPGGQLIVTFPLGYNPHLDHLLRAGALPLSQIDCLRRTGKWHWEQLPWEPGLTADYDRPFPCANVVVIATYQAPG